MDVYALLTQRNVKISALFLTHLNTYKLTVSETQTRYPPRTVVNLYREDSRELWDDVERQIRSEYDAEDETVGVVAAQCFAMVLGVPGPLDSETA